VLDGATVRNLTVGAALGDASALKVTASGGTPYCLRWSNCRGYPPPPPRHSAGALDPRPPVSLKIRISCGSTNQYQRTQKTVGRHWTFWLTLPVEMQGQR